MRTAPCHGSWGLDSPWEMNQSVDCRHKFVRIAVSSSRWLWAGYRDSTGLAQATPCLAHSGRCASQACALSSVIIVATLGVRCFAVSSSALWLNYDAWDEVLPRTRSRFGLGIGKRIVRLHSDARALGLGGGVLPRSLCGLCCRSAIPRSVPKMLFHVVLDWVTV